MKQIKFIGLDISTSIVGVSFLDKNGEMIDLKAVNLKKIKCIFDKSKAIKESFLLFKSTFNIDENVKIFIEEPFQSFSKGFSSAKTLSQLNRFNGIVSYLSAEVFSCIPLYINVNSARKTLQLKINKKSDLSTKDQVFNWVKNQVQFSWPEKILKSGPNKGLVKFHESCYDMSDAYVICKAGFINEGQNL